MVRFNGVNYTITSIGDRAFFGCSGLTSLTITPGLTSIGNRAFCGCSGLSSIDIPENVTNIEIGAFQNCSGLTSIGIPDNVTNVKEATFYGCSGLTSISINSKVKDIDYLSFGDCTNLKHVFCMAESVPTTSAAAFNGSPIDKATLHVPKSAISTYQATAPWSEFGQIVALEDADPPTPVVPTPDPTPRCATPTISIKDGKLEFDCETEGVEYHYQIIMPESQESIGNQVPLPNTITIKVYASKENYIDSEIATKDIGLLLGIKGDMNDDGVTDAADIVNLVNVIMTKNAEVEEPEIIIITSD